MGSTLDVQFLSLVISIITVFAMIILAIFRKRARAFYISMIIGWVPGIVYYVGVIYFYQEFLGFFKIPALDASAGLRIFQYSIFGMWFILDAADTIIKKVRLENGYRNLKDSIRKLKNEADGCNRD